MTDSEKNRLFNYIHSRRYAVEATVNSAIRPEAAVIGIAVTSALALVFDTKKTSRKYRNILQNPHLALVIGWDDETTIQYEGIAVELTGEKLVEAKKIYFAKFPDGIEREKWPEIVYLMVVPRWIRFSDFSGQEPRIQEWSFK